MLIPEEPAQAVEQSVPLHALPRRAAQLAELAGCVRSAQVKGLSFEAALKPGLDARAESAVVALLKVRRKLQALDERQGLVREPPTDVNGLLVDTLLLAERLCAHDGELLRELGWDVPRAMYPAAHKQQCRNLLEALHADKAPTISLGTRATVAAKTSPPVTPRTAGRARMPASTRASSAPRSDMQKYATILARLEERDDRRRERGVASRNHLGPAHPTPPSQRH